MLVSAYGTDDRRYGRVSFNLGRKAIVSRPTKPLPPVDEFSAMRGPLSCAFTITQSVGDA